MSNIINIAERLCSKHVEENNGECSGCKYLNDVEEDWYCKAGFEVEVEEVEEVEDYTVCNSMYLFDSIDDRDPM